MTSRLSTFFTLFISIPCYKCEMTLTISSVNTGCQDGLGSQVALLVLPLDY